MEEVFIFLAALVGVMFFALMVTVYSAFAWGWVFFKFWGWFILPVFTLPEINFWQAVGLMFFVLLFQINKAHIQEKDEKDKKKQLTIALAAIIAPWVTLFAGWFIHSII